MITLRTLEIESTLDPDMLLTNLQWNTEKLTIAPLNLFNFFFKFDISRPWLGEIDRSSRTFKLINNKKRSEYTARISGIVCKGHIVRDFDKSLITIDLQPNGFIFLSSLTLAVVAICGVILTPADVLIEFWWAVLFWVVSFTLNFISLNSDLNKTQAKLFEYFEMQDTESKRSTPL